MDECQGGTSCGASRRALPGASPDGGLQPAILVPPSNFGWWTAAGLPRHRQCQSYMKHTTTSYTPKNDPSGIVSVKVPPPFKSVFLPDLLSSTLRHAL